MDTTTLPEAELMALASAYPDLPSEYFAYLRNVGSGEAASGRMIYGGPVPAQDIYGTSFVRTDIVLLGDDLAGFCFGYDLINSIYGEVSPNGIWQPWPVNQGFEHYVGA